MTAAPTDAVTAKVAPWTSHRLTDRRAHPLGDALRLLVPRVVAEHDELIAAQSGDRVLGARGRQYPLTDERDEGIADLVAVESLIT